MKRLFFSFLLFVLSFSICTAQPTTAMDFTMNDCASGQVHNLYSILDSGNAVIMEFFMINCSPCIDAGKALDSMYKKLKVDCPNVRYSQTSFNNSDKCGAIYNWADSNNFSSVPFDSGAAQISYYGFFGMPTVAVAAGSTHKLLYLLISGGFNDNDTAVITDSIRKFCGPDTTGIPVIKNNFSFSVFPKPASENFTISLAAKEAGTLVIELKNVLGENIQTLADEKISAGEWKRNFSSYGLSPGIYFLRMRLNNSVLAGKAVIQ